MSYQEIDKFTEAMRRVLEARTVFPNATCVAETGSHRVVFGDPENLEIPIVSEDNQNGAGKTEVSGVNQDEERPAPRGAIFPPPPPLPPVLKERRSQVDGKGKGEEGSSKAERRARNVGLFEGLMNGRWHRRGSGKVPRKKS